MKYIITMLLVFGLLSVCNADYIYVEIDPDNSSKANVMGCHCGYKKGLPCGHKITSIGIGYNHAYEGCNNNGELVWTIPDKKPDVSGFDNCTEVK